MNLLTQIFGSGRRRRYRAAAVLLIAAGLSLPARACWTIIMTECFDRPINTWPWTGWHVAPSSPRWGVSAADYFDVVLCPDDNQSLWCYGFPVANDPEFDEYPSNYDTYAAWGPFSLANAVAAQCAFRLWNRTEIAHDSIFWGAATSYNLTNALMKISGSLSYETPNGWQSKLMDLSNLRDYLTGDSVSMLGQSAVYVFWRFRSDANNIRDVGSFIDNIAIAVDDGGRNLIASEMTLLRPDSTPDYEPMLGDTLLLSWGWRVCTGGVGAYDPFRVVLTLNDSVVADTTVSGALSGDNVNLISAPWVASTPGTFLFRVKVDSMNVIAESNENDNADTLSYFIYYNPPPDFAWITPGADTLWADSLVTLRWTLADPGEMSWASIYSSSSPVSCTGALIPGGSNRPALPGGFDSLNWNVHSLPNFHTYYIFAQVMDSSNNMCVYAQVPVIIDHTGAARQVPGAVPEAYFLAQNYPNPFNPATEIRYGIAVPGHVTLRVYNVLGQDQAELVNSDLGPGIYSATFNGTGLTSGVYVAVLTTPEGTLRQKMMLLR